MLQHAPIAALAPRRSITIDLIGDLDAHLGETLVKTLETLACDETCDVFVNFKRVAGVEAAGLSGAARAIAQKRLAGWSISALVSRRNRRVCVLLNSSRIPCDEAPAIATNTRHIMIARNAALSNLPA